MANAVLEHKLSLDDDVRMYLQEDYPNLQYNGHPIRVRHLLSHTSGLPNMLPDRANTALPSRSLAAGRQGRGLRPPVRA